MTDNDKSNGRSCKPRVSDAAIEELLKHHHRADKKKRALNCVWCKALHDLLDCRAKRNELHQNYQKLWFRWETYSEEIETLRAERDKLRKKNDGYTRTINRWQKVAARLDQQLQEKSVTLKELREETIVARECARKQNEHIVKLGHDYYKLQQTMVGDLAKHNTLREAAEELRGVPHAAKLIAVLDTESDTEVSDE